MQVTAGRFNQFLVDGNLYDNPMDGVNLVYGNKVKVGAYYGRPTDQVGYDADLNQGFDYNKAWGANVSTDMGGFNLTAGYDKFTNSEAKADLGSGLDDNGVWNVGAKYNFNDKASLGAIYMKSDLDVDSMGDNLSNKGIVVTGTIMGADEEKPGSWGLWGKFYDQGMGTVIAHTMNGYYSTNGFKGWGAGLNYTFAPHMVGAVEYYDLDRKGDSTSDKTIWSELAVTF